MSEYLKRSQLKVHANAPLANNKNDRKGGSTMEPHILVHDPRPSGL